jgi:outer membrane murein-binding lipoprotein Lpp
VTAALAIWAAIQRIGAGALSFLGKLNIWQLLLIAALLVAGVQTIRLKSEQRHSAKLQTQVSKLAQELNRISDTTHKAQADAARISQQLKDKNDEDNRRIAGDANSLRLRGPGKSLCRPAPAASGDGTRPAKPDASGPALPPDDSAAVPWGWLVQRSEEHDQLLAEVQAWRTWHDEVLKVWPKNTEAAPK